MSDSCTTLGNWGRFYQFLSFMHNCFLLSRLMYSYSKMPLTIDLPLLLNYMKFFYDKYLGSLKLLFPELSPKIILQSILYIFKKLSFVAELTFLNEVNFQHNISWKFDDPCIFTLCIV